MPEPNDSARSNEFTPKERHRLMEEINRGEIEKLRDRVHDFGNSLQEQAAHLSRVEGSIENLDRKLDAFNGSISGHIAEFKADVKEDLTEIKTETRATNGKVAEHDRKISMLWGGLMVMAAGLPVLTGLLVFVLGKLVH